MRSLIFIIVISAFLLWFGINFRDTNRKIARISLVIGSILALLALVGMLRLV